MPLYIWNAIDLYSEIDVTNADNPGGHVIGRLYEIKKGTAGSAFFCLRQQSVPHKEGDTMLVLDVDHRHLKNVVVLINDRTATFKSWAFQDLIDTQSIKLVK